jgi:hypothetical protein
VCPPSVDGKRKLNGDAHGHRLAVEQAWAKAPLPCNLDRFFVESESAIERSHDPDVGDRPIDRDHRFNECDASKPSGPSPRSCRTDAPHERQHGSARAAGRVPTERERVEGLVA